MSQASAGIRIHSRNFLNRRVGPQIHEVGKLMKITYSYQGKEAVFNTDSEQIVIGRPLAGVPIQLDLTPDRKVSRPHARIWAEYGRYWIEDLNSAAGTRINGEELKNRGRRRLHSNDSVAIGETTLRFELPENKDEFPATLSAESDASLEDCVTQSVDAAQPAFSRTQTTSDSDRRLAFFYELPLKLAAEAQLPGLLQLIVEQSLDVISGARRGALFISERQTRELLRVASIPVDNPAVSLTLAAKAIDQCEGFIWSRSLPVDNDQEQDGIPGSAFEHNIQSAIYAPLIWKGEALGVVCVDNDESSGAFGDDDRRLLQAVAHQAAMAIAHLEAEKNLRTKARVLQNFMKLVSPPLAERLMHYQGPIRPGGEFRQATILFSDMRGFTQLSSRMDPEDVSEMIEDYFSRLVPIVFEHKGMIDKYVGDAIVAVFGSPSADEQQYYNSVRAALEMQSTMQSVNNDRKIQGKITTELGIGINCGEVVHGFIGSPDRMEFTVIGDAVNRASRYCDGAGKGQVLISPEMYERVWGYVEAEQISIPTKHEGELTAYWVKRLKD